MIAWNDAVIGCAGPATRSVVTKALWENPRTGSDVAIVRPNIAVSSQAVRASAQAGHLVDSVVPPQRSDAAHVHVRGAAIRKCSSVIHIYTHEGTCNAMTAVRWKLSSA
jgi:hypothetical protein